MNVRLGSGSDIRLYRFHNKPHVQIHYSFHMEQRLAAKHSNLTWDEYQRLPGSNEWVDVNNPCDSKADIVAFYRMDSLIHAISSDVPPPKGKGKRKSG